MQILIVDDDPIIQRIARRCLAQRGYAVTCLSSGSEALAWIEKNAVDVIVSDYELPGANGLEILSRVKELYPGSARLMMSGQLDLQNTMEAVNRGEVARVIQKPFSAEQLVSAVEEALGLIRRVGEHYALAADSSRAEQGKQLDACFEHNLLRLALQPIFDAESRDCYAYEALLRSSHEVLKGPFEILQAVEAHERIFELSECTSKLGAAWFKFLPGNEKLFLNLHPAELGDPKSLLERFSVLASAAERIVIEVTERSSVNNLPACRTSVQGLRDLGFSIALDDLGAGYSSLSMLAELKPNYIKIDMSLIRDIHLDTHRQQVVKLVCDLALTLDAQVVAEGIENDDELAACIDCGVHLLQGFHLARPSDKLWKAP